MHEFNQRPAERASPMAGELLPRRIQISDLPHAHRFAPPPRVTVAAGLRTARESVGMQGLSRKGGKYIQRIEKSTT